MREGAVGGTESNVLGHEETGAVRGASVNGITLQQLLEQLRMCQESATPTQLQLQILKEKVRRCQAALGRQTGAIPKAGPSATRLPTLTTQSAPEQPIPPIQFTKTQISQALNSGAHSPIIFYRQ